MGLKNKWRYIYEDWKDPRSFTYWAGKIPGAEDEDGSGQYGIIFTAKVAAEKEKAEGEAKANAPFFKKGLIPGLDFSLFDFAKIGLSIAGGGPWMSFALDAVDTMSQVVGGDMSLGDGLLNVAKGAATTAVGNFTGGLADSWGASWSQSMGSSFVGSTLAKVSSSAINQAANIAISGFNLQHGWSMDKDVFKQQMLGAAKSMAISTSTAVGSGAINSN